MTSTSTSRVVTLRLVRQQSYLSRRSWKKQLVAINDMLPQWQTKSPTRHPCRGQHRKVVLFPSRWWDWEHQLVWWGYVLSWLVAGTFILLAFSWRHHCVHHTARLVVQLDRRCQAQVTSLGNSWFVVHYHRHLQVGCCRALPQHRKCLQCRW